MSEVIERVARAIFEADHPGAEPAVLAMAWAITPTWNPRPKYCAIARAAIMAMREPCARQLAQATLTAAFEEPSEADMAITGAVLELLPPTGHPEARIVIAEMARDFRAMIDAALRASPASPAERSAKPRERV